MHFLKFCTPHAVRCCMHVLQPWHSQQRLLLSRLAWRTCCFDPRLFARLALRCTFCVCTAARRFAFACAASAVPCTSGSAFCVCVCGKCRSEPFAFAYAALPLPPTPHPCLGAWRRGMRRHSVTECVSLGLVARDAPSLWDRVRVFGLGGAESKFVLFFAMAKTLFDQRIFNYVQPPSFPSVPL